MTKDKKKSSKKRKSIDIIMNDDDDGGDTTTSNYNNNNDDNKQSHDKKKLKKEKKKKKKLKKEKKEKKKSKNENNEQQSSLKPHDITATPNNDDLQIVGGRIVSYSASIINKTTEDDNENHNLDNDKEEEEQYERKQVTKEKIEDNDDSKSGCTLLLFYQYIEPMLDENGFQQLLNFVSTTLENHKMTGRARVANEGLNCTLTGSYDNVRLWCKSLRSYCNGQYFAETEFKLTDNLPMGQAFTKLHAFQVEEIVNYGLAGERAPKVEMTGVHLEPKDYHEKMTEDNTVIIDVRNHYEAAIGKFTPPANGAQYIDPMMRKSTEFPVWLDKPETKEMLRGKQVLMYCTGGVRCERASALLKTKIETEEDTKALGIKGVYQLQGGIDKYFRDFPEGGWWKGKNYVFGKFM